MKTLPVGALLLLLSLPVFAQSVASANEGYQAFTVPSGPTVLDLTKLFTETTQGLDDPFMVLRKTGSMGDAVIPALPAFLFNTPILRVGVLDPDGNTIDSVNAPPISRFHFPTYYHDCTSTLVIHRSRRGCRKKGNLYCRGVS